MLSSYVTESNFIRFFVINGEYSGENIDQLIENAFQNQKILVDKMHNVLYELIDAIEYSNKNLLAVLGYSLR